MTVTSAESKIASMLILMYGFSNHLSKMHEVFTELFTIMIFISGACNVQILATPNVRYLPKLIAPTNFAIGTDSWRKYGWGWGKWAKTNCPLNNMDWIIPEAREWLITMVAEWWGGGGSWKIRGLGENPSMWYSNNDNQLLSISKWSPLGTHHRSRGAFEPLALPVCVIHC